MRKLFVLVFCLVPCILFAQKDTTGIEAALKKLVDKRPFYVLNGVVVDEVNNIKPDTILDITILNAVSTERPSSTIIINTVQAAKNSYQKRFGLLSERYRDYLLKNNGNDDKIEYIVNDVYQSWVVKTRISNLFNIKPKDIRSFKFSLNKDLKDGNKAATVIIKTKNNGK